MFGFLFFLMSMVASAQHGQPNVNNTWFQGNNYYSGIDSLTHRTTIKDTLSFKFGSDTTGDVYYLNSAKILKRLPIGTAGQVMSVSGGLPAWVAAAGVSTNLGNSDLTQNATPRTYTMFAGGILNFKNGAGGSQFKIIRSDNASLFSTDESSNEMWIGETDDNAHTPTADVSISGIGGNVTLGGQAYQYPNSQTAGAGLVTNGSGGLTYSLKVDTVFNNSGGDSLIYRIFGRRHALKYPNSGGSVTSVGSGYGLSGGTITTSGTLLVDSATLSVKYWQKRDTISTLASQAYVLSHAGTGTVTSVSGTTNRITSTGGTTPVIDISASYVGQSSITTVGTIGTGVWHGTAIDSTYLNVPSNVIEGSNVVVTTQGKTKTVSVPTDSIKNKTTLQQAITNGNVIAHTSSALMKDSAGHTILQTNEIGSGNLKINYYDYTGSLQSTMGTDSSGNIILNSPSEYVRINNGANVHYELHGDDTKIGYPYSNSYLFILEDHFDYVNQAGDIFYHVGPDDDGETYYKIKIAGNAVKIFSLVNSAQSCAMGDIDNIIAGIKFEVDLKNGLYNFYNLTGTISTQFDENGKMVLYGTASINDNDILLGSGGIMEKKNLSAVFPHGSFSATGVATTTFTVTIGATMANTSYFATITPTNALSAAVWYINNKTTTTFDVHYLAGLTGAVAFDFSTNP